MSELRKDPVIGRWVIIAAERSKRPADFITVPKKNPNGFCPFCPGHEEKTLDETLSEAETENENSEWLLRVVPNKFPALVRDGELKTQQDNLYESITGVGVHEVVIENPSHTLSFADYTDSQAEIVVKAFRNRLNKLTEDTRARYIMIFKNYGVAAGASLDHPHSQIISLPVIPKRVKEEMKGALKYFDRTKRCLFCDIIQREIEVRKRIVIRNGRFIALTPYASRFPFEMWILPTDHESRFETISHEWITDFARILRDTLGRIKTVLHDPSYNFMLHTSPCHESVETQLYYHWHLEITPKLTQVAGFEWGTGFYINPMPPEQAAAYLRGDEELEDDTILLHQNNSK